MINEYKAFCLTAEFSISQNFHNLQNGKMLKPGIVFST